MFAKSAPQLFASPIRTLRATSLHMHATLLVLAVAIITLGTGWATRDGGQDTLESSALEPQAQESTIDRSPVEHVQPPAAAPRPR